MISAFCRSPFNKVFFVPTSTLILLIQVFKSITARTEGKKSKWFHDITSSCSRHFRLLPVPHFHQGTVSWVLHALLHPHFYSKEKERKNLNPHKPQKPDLNLTRWHVPFSWEHCKAHSRNGFTFLCHSESTKSWAVMDEDVLPRLTEMWNISKLKLLAFKWL